MKTKAEIETTKKVKAIDMSRKLRGRFKKLSYRKKNPMSIGAFCLKHGFHKAHISRIINIIVIAKEDTILKIDSALKQEGA